MTSLPLAVLGFLTVIIMLVLIMTKKASPLVALIAVPVVTGIIACFFMTGEDTAGMGTMERFTTNFKGLGEISDDEFRDFIGPDMRLDRVTLRKEDAVQEMLAFYMGKNTMERQNFIIDNLVLEDEEDITK